ncbi:MAG: hypothetical protein EU536_04870 [Promethearchaeota archaeon]|nr:MAG: hypothetical protein EU536_04870 [Candidatus Lokiarchaeota archaeon]
MINHKEIHFARLISVALHIFSVIIIPLIIGFSFFLQRKIDQAFERYGRDETIKLINIMGIFGLLTILFSPKRKKLPN